LLAPAPAPEKPKPAGDTTTVATVPKPVNEEAETSIVGDQQQNEAGKEEQQQAALSPSAEPETAPHFVESVDVSVDVAMKEEPAVKQESAEQTLLPAAAEACAELAQADATSATVQSDNSEAMKVDEPEIKAAVKVATVGTVKVGHEVFFVKTRSKLVFPHQVYTKGYDASNEWDEEVPEEVRWMLGLMNMLL
jgi:hypothetical protein